jgi:L-fuconolactonase
MWKQSVYLLPELLRDVNDGPNVVSTVYVQAFSFHRSFGPEEERPEVEFAQGVAAMADSGQYGQCRAHAAIVGFC